VKPGDLVKIHFWNKPHTTDLFGIIILVLETDPILNAKWYKVWVDGALAEFAKEELEIIE
jgi:hypothetical protein